MKNFIVVFDVSSKLAFSVPAECEEQARELAKVMLESINFSEMNRDGGRLRCVIETRPASD